MGKTGYLIIAIAVIIALIAIFIISFVLYHRTPAPKGCETLKISEGECSACSHKECRFHQEKEENKQ